MTNPYKYTYLNENEFLSTLLTGMSKDRNFCWLFNLRDKFIAASWDDQINDVIKLQQQSNLETAHQKPMLLRIEY